ncbi:MAG: hypothetical protein JWL70_1708 [Acidimicrobiia bacterium]|nr:hypothetical protein [Acidimicrobiia bacterium]
MIRLRPDDDYFLSLHSTATPMQIGALLLFDVPTAERPNFAEAVRHHLRERLPATALARVRRSPPWHLDSDAWFAVSDVDLSALATVHTTGSPVPRAELEQLVARWVMQQLDPQQPPFRMVIVPEVAEGGSAIFFTILHALADGIGFQSIMESLTDPTADAESRRALVDRDERIPSRPEWVARSLAALARDAWNRRKSAEARDAAEQALAAFKADPAHKRAKTPTFSLSSPTSNQRSYTAMSLPLARLQELARALDGTVNDVFLALAGGALRSFLLSIDALPDTPIVVNAARSYRRAEHGTLGNRIVSLHPHLATTMSEPRQRFVAIQQSMASELERSRLQESLMDQGARPFGARHLRRQVAERLGSGGAVLPGNVSLSNVPGPAAPRFLAGYRLTASYPAPILGAGRFLNITLRRYVDQLDLGIMTDAAKVPDATVIAEHLCAALDELDRTTMSR